MLLNVQSVTQLINMRTACHIVTFDVSPALHGGAFKLIQRQWAAANYQRMTEEIIKPTSG